MKNKKKKYNPIIWLCVPNPDSFVFFCDIIGIFATEPWWDSPCEAWMVNDCEDYETIERDFVEKWLRIKMPKFPLLVEFNLATGKIVQTWLPPDEEG